jgi:hypothetical protein
MNQGAPGALATYRPLRTRILSTNRKTVRRLCGRGLLSSSVHLRLSKVYLWENYLRLLFVYGR